MGEPVGDSGFGTRTNAVMAARDIRMSSSAGGCPRRTRMLGSKLRAFRRRFRRRSWYRVRRMEDKSCGHLSTDRNQHQDAQQLCEKRNQDGEKGTARCWKV